MLPILPYALPMLSVLPYDSCMPCASHAYLSCLHFLLPSLCFLILSMLPYALLMLPDISCVPNASYVSLSFLC